MSKPTIVCVPGAWHRPEVYERTLSILQTHGYPTIGLHEPSVGANPPHESFEGDVEGIRSCVSKLTEEGKEIILAFHSYTGMPACEALEGLGRKERQEKGLEGGVIRLVFIMAFAMPEGFQPTAGGAQFPDWMKVDKERGVVTMTREDARRIMYNDLSEEESDFWAARLLPQSLSVYDSKTTYAAWKYIPSTFVIGEQDATTFRPAVVDWMITNAREAVPGAFDQVERCGGGHCLMLSHPECLTDVFRKAAGEKV